MTHLIHEIIKDNFGYIVTDLNQMAGGNSRVFKVHCDNGIELIAKLYPPTDQDPRNRLKTEYNAFSFLHKNGIQHYTKYKYGTVLYFRIQRMIQMCTFFTSRYVTLCPVVSLIRYIFITSPGKNP